MNGARGHPHRYGRADRPTGAPWHSYWRCHGKRHD